MKQLDFDSLLGTSAVSASHKLGDYGFNHITAKTYDGEQTITLYFISCCDRTEVAVTIKRLYAFSPGGNPREGMIVEHIKVTKPPKTQNGEKIIEQYQ